MIATRLIICFFCMTIGLKVCDTDNSCKTIFKGNLQYCMNESYSGNYVTPIFADSEKIFRILHKENGDKLEVSWKNKDSLVTTAKEGFKNWDIYVSDLIKRGEHISLISIDTSEYVGTIEIAFHDKDIYYLEKSFANEKGFYTVKYERKNLEECLKDKQRIYGLVNKIKAL